MDDLKAAPVQQVTPPDDEPSLLADLGAYDPVRGERVPRIRSRNAQRLAIEHGVTDALARSTDLNEAAPLLVRAVCEELGWACGTCWMEDAATGTLTSVGRWGQAGSAIRAFVEGMPTIRLSAGQGGLVRRAWSTGQPVWIDDVVSEPTFRRAALAAAAGLQSALAFPITASRFAWFWPSMVPPLLLV